MALTFVKDTQLHYFSLTCASVARCAQNKAELIHTYIKQRFNRSDAMASTDRAPLNPKDLLCPSISWREDLPFEEQCNACSITEHLRTIICSFERTWGTPQQNAPEGRLAN